ncbi:RluA family pseudouridine synthase [Candidatus Saccharibacteria bacterium]|nr:RluA family pseudouridine synthase [Candidatus Saccharibacteria bacterium]MCA9328736.1 RluA family pseudouridine synthase [Candidatus Saccharibacteria bacterium]
MKQTYTITESDGVVRVDKFLAAKYPEYSRAAIAKLFTLNLIKLGGVPLLPGHKLRPGTTFEYDLGPLSEKPEVIELPVLYEDDDVIVVNKPAGIISHARGRFWQEASVASFIRDRISGMDGERGGIVHRLDRATSGVMICAKNEASLSFLQKQFSERSVEKTYIAVVSGSPEHDEAIIDAPIGRDLKAPKMFRVDPDGKSAQTTYKVLEKSAKHSLLELKPKTGRTHQLRVHLAYIKTPIVGDELYKGEVFERLLLHAKSLKIKLSDGKVRTFTSEVPTQFREMLK